VARAGGAGVVDAGAGQARAIWANTGRTRPHGARGRGGGLAEWWPLAALLVLAAALRFSTLGLQSLWYDEAFGPVHLFHPSLIATLEGIPRTENTPPLWYILEWAVIRVAGDGAVALRVLSALAGTATVAVAWAIGRELSGRRAAILTAGLVAFSPLFVWYSQEARAYALYTFLVAVALWCFLRAERAPGRRRMAAFAAASALALLTHYFAVFLVVPMALWLVLAGSRESRPRALAALAAIGAVGAALLPLALAQGGRGAEWIGKLTLVSRVEAVPQYYLTGYSGAPLGHGVELAVAVPLLAGFFFGLWRITSAAENRAAARALGVAACGIVLPLVLVPFGADYFDPRNLVGAMVPLTAGLAVVIGARRSGRVGMALGALAMAAFVAISIDVDRSRRLQRGNWRAVAEVLRGPVPGGRAISTVHLGSAPLEYYMSGVHGLAAGAVVRARVIDEVGYSPLAADAASPPVPGFRLESRREVDGLYVYRFAAATPREVAASALIGHPLTSGQGLPQVLASGRAGASAQG
jgi:mannosyltransferase